MIKINSSSINFKNIINIGLSAKKITDKKTSETKTNTKLKKVVIKTEKTKIKNVNKKTTDKKVKEKNKNNNTIKKDIKKAVKAKVETNDEIVVETKQPKLIVLPECKDCQEKCKIEAIKNSSLIYCPDFKNKN